MVDLEAEEGAEDIDTEGVDPISKLPDYIPLHKGKVNITKDPDAEKFLINTPLESVIFEYPYLAQIPHLKLED